MASSVAEEEPVLPQDPLDQEIALLKRQGTQTFRPATSISVVLYIANLVYFRLQWLHSARDSR